MRIPSPVEQEIETLAHGISLATLTKHFQLYSQAYREGKASQLSLPSRIGKICYLATRLPATLGAMAKVLQEYERRMGRASSLLDLGAGPGTTLLAMMELGWEVKSATLLELSQEFIELGKRWLPSSTVWKKSDFTKSETFPESELVTLCYSLGEIAERDLNPLLTKAWTATKNSIIIVEPGTPRGFKRMLYARDYLISCGAHMVAPCPCNLPCPMPKNDWCHFSARIERTSLHRRMKSAQLGYEDEKFSYIILAKAPASSCAARLIKSPGIHPGRITLTLCAPEGIQNKIALKKDGEFYKHAKKLNWGDSI